ncbi:hypothetical protein KAFR_0C06500 [Kazachstania africana CBS 2517]|uniref:Uncharacterized protein n=1 Tax=Kazachstania africana (strain ATCC 22294 / BCRC 22015 / CBS 2517 / CECT 1963 / NBRC 1671 / NRRL Y-8276) TaxID=1071382 RepID=H2ATE6_KAZAF|nr:hypothetical protein KAFR_0C06500 [Kazachstania africana CBS 2517]CCF57646.1 hypothetical protein KAFR_0C06500 [Kazachstania africana CBS 2517]
MSFQPNTKVDILYEGTTVAFAHVVDNEYFHTKKINVKSELQCSLIRLLDNIPNKIPLYLADPVEHYTLLNELPKGTLFIWNKKNVLISTANSVYSSEDHTPLEAVNNGSNDISLAGTDDDDDGAEQSNHFNYTLLHNQEKDNLNLSLIWSKRKNKNPHLMFFSQLDDLTKVCQFYNPISHTICNYEVVFRDMTEQRKLAARKCQSHINKYHDLQLDPNSAEKVLKHICPARKDYDTLKCIVSEQEKDSKDVATLDEYSPKVKLRKISTTPQPPNLETASSTQASECFTEFISMLLASGASPLSLLESEHFKEWCQEFMPDVYSDSWSKERADTLVKSQSESIICHIKDLFTSHAGDLQSTPLSFQSFEGTGLEGQIKASLKKLNKAYLPWTSIEVSGLSENEESEPLSVTISLLTKDFKKATFPVFIDHIGPKHDEKICSSINEISTDLSMDRFVTSLCTNDVYNVANLGNALQNEGFLNNFKAYSGCVVKQVEILVKSIITDITDVLRKAGKEDLLTPKDYDEALTGNHSGLQLSDCPAIVSKLLELQRKLKFEKNIRSMFTNCVPTLPADGSDMNLSVLFHNLKHFLENSKGYLSFSMQLKSTSDDYSFDYSSTDLEIARLLYETLIPLNAIMLLTKEKNALSSSYVPLLLWVREVAKACTGSLTRWLKKMVSFPKFNENFDLLYSEFLANDYIYHAIGLFHSDVKHVVHEGKWFSLDFYALLSDIAYKILHFDFQQREINNQSSVSTMFDFENRNRKNSPKQTEIFPVDMEWSRSEDSLSGQCKEVLYNMVKEEVKNFNVWRSQNYIKSLQETIKEMGIKLSSDEFKTLLSDDFDSFGNFRGESIVLKENRFIIRTKCSLRLLERYLEIARNDTQASNQHSRLVLPIVIRYLLSFSVTTGNLGRMGNQMKDQFNETFDEHDYPLNIGRNRLSERLIAQTIKSLNISTSMNELDNVGLQGLLERQ